MSRPTRRIVKLPEPADIHRDVIDKLIEELGHDPKKVLRVRIGPREVQVDLLPPRRDVLKFTVAHAVIGPEDDE